MKNRRAFLTTSAAAAAAIGLGGEGRGERLEAIGEAARDPILDLSSFREPVLIESIELLRNKQEFLVRIRSRDGAESVTVPNSSRLAITHPIFLRRVAPFFVGKDVRQLEALFEALYRNGSNYKLQGLAYWVCVAAVEMGILDLLGKLSGKSIGGLFGGVIQKDVAVYRASGNRGNRPEEEVEYLKKLVTQTGVAALKFRLGGRMSNNADSLPGRTEALIPLVRESFGKDMTLYADSNSSYGVKEAVRIGRLMEEHGYALFEEPCRFDHLWETKAVADALKIPVAGGEQEFSMRRFRWVIENRGVDIVQPDLHYFGGYLRCTRVARMAEAAGMDCTVHMSGSGLGYLNTIHFASYVRNAGAHQEFKGESRIPMEVTGSDLRCRNGTVRVPRGPGFGVTIDPDFVAAAEVVKG